MLNKIGKHFTYGELTITKSKLENIPSQDELNNLLHLVENVLDPLRELYGKPIHVNSGFRSKEVNSAIGGAIKSQHCKGQAADITGGSKEENEKLFNLIKDNLKYDQLINEKDFS